MPGHPRMGAGHCVAREWSRRAELRVATARPEGTLGKTWDSSLAETTPDHPRGVAGVRAAREWGTGGQLHVATAWPSFSWKSERSPVARGRSPSFRAGARVPSSAGAGRPRPCSPENDNGRPLAWGRSAVSMRGERAGGVNCESRRRVLEILLEGLSRTVLRQVRPSVYISFGETMPVHPKEVVGHRSCVVRRAGLADREEMAECPKNRSRWPVALAHGGACFRSGRWAPCALEAQPEAPTSREPRLRSEDRATLWSAPLAARASGRPEMLALIALYFMRPPFIATIEEDPLDSASIASVHRDHRGRPLRRRLNCPAARSGRVQEIPNHS